MNYKRLITAFTAAVLTFSFQTHLYANENVMFDGLGADDSSIVIIYTNDVHGGASNHEQYSGSTQSLGFAGVAALKEKANTVAAGVSVVDLGDALQGSILCSQSEGKDVIDIMNAVGYDVAVMGNHEFDYGIEAALDVNSQLDSGYIAVNFEDLKTGEQVLEPYKIITYDVKGEEIKIAYIGIMTPENISKGTPTNFQDEAGNYIYGFNADSTDEFYAIIQDGIDSALNEGADYVIGCGHLGDEGITEGWSSIDVIKNTTGLNAFLDGHAHSMIDEEKVLNAEGKEVILSSTGTKLNQIGIMVLNVENGQIDGSTYLVNTLSDEEKQSEAYKEIDELVTSIEKKYEYLMEIVGTSEYGLYIYDPITKDRLIRTQETNLGDFISDAFRHGLNADIAFSAGGNIRADLPAGDINFLNIMNVLPWGDAIVKIEVTGQQILDSLEMGARLWPEQSGGFIHASGLTYAIDIDVVPTVKTSLDGLFESVEGEYRVKDVKVNDQELDLDKVYTLAIDDYYYTHSGDGMSMFKDCKAIVSAEDKVIDNQLVVDYLTYLDGVIPAEYENLEGQGRIKFITANESVVDDAAEDNTKVTVGLFLAICFIGLIFIFLRKKKAR